MTGPHVDPGTLAAFSDGALDRARSAAIAAHLQSCAGCRSAIEDVSELEALVLRAEAGRGGPERPLAPAVDLRIDDVIGDALAGRAARPARWVRFALPLGAAAAVLALWIGLAAGPRPVRIAGSVLVGERSADVRGAPDRRFHFEIEVDRPTHLAIFEVHVEAGVTLLYPSANPILGTFGRTEPFPAGGPHRIPPAALADYPARVSGGDPVCLAVPLPALTSAEALAPALAEIRAALPRGLDAVRQQLRARFGAVADLPVRPSR
jgi:hypothetical protein